MLTTPAVGGQLSGTRDFVPGLSGQGLRVPETSLKTWTDLGFARIVGLPRTARPLEGRGNRVQTSHRFSCQERIGHCARGQAEPGVVSPIPPPPGPAARSRDRCPPLGAWRRVVRAEDGSLGPGFSGGGSDRAGIQLNQRQERQQPAEAPGRTEL